MKLPLDGITVVSIELAVAAPLATRHLVDLGARVIKIERPGAGDFARGYDSAVQGQSSYFVWLNRGKQSIELDIKNSADRQILDTMIDAADVFVHNLVPGAIDRLGLGATETRAKNPRLIHCSISGYGSSGPYQTKKAYDLLIQCEAGLVAATGTPEEPAKVGISIADISTGMYAYAGILSALYARERTGEGSTLEVAMLDALGEWMMQPAYYSAYGGTESRRTGARHASIAPYGPHRAGDGTSVFFGIQNDREWAVFCQEILGRPDLITDVSTRHNVDRVANVEELTRVIERALSSMTADEALERLEGAGIACARLRPVGELFEHPQLVHRNRWRLVETPSGSVRALLPPVIRNGHDPFMGAVPALGEHNAELRAEFAADPAQPG